MSMNYMIFTTIIDGNCKHEKVDYIKGTRELEKFTDSRIVSMHSNAKEIYKVYPDSSCIKLV